jgi:hypothetical protein
MPDLAYNMLFSLKVDDREFKLIGRALTGKIKKTSERQEALILASKILVVRERILQEQSEQTKRIQDEITSGTPCPVRPSLHSNGR